MTQPLSYHDVMPRPSENCGICYEELKEDVVDHDGDYHPFHQTCIKAWLVASSKCPAYWQDVNPSSLGN